MFFCVHEDGVGYGDTIEEAIRDGKNQVSPYVDTDNCIFYRAEKVKVITTYTIEEDQPTG